MNNVTNYPVYTGTDLGLTYSPQSSTFKVWSPAATAAEIRFYKEGEGGTAVKTISMQAGENGVWIAKVDSDVKGLFYTYTVKINNEWRNEVVDPYAKAVGINGLRAQVVDLKETNPVNWEKDKAPAFSSKNVTTDAIIYELHVRDATIHPSSKAKNKGKFLGLAEILQHDAENYSAGLAHIKKMGVTHVHLLPFFDYKSVDEKRNDQYNWGYDPLNYNVPEGSYSTNPYDGNVRIKELKQMVQAFHQNGLRVVMDVVYNHTADAVASNFHQLVPGYYYRHKPDGSFSDATACGNETASEMPMMRKFLIESVTYWAKEYHIDGFRFDLMAVHDIETMNEIAKALHAINPEILIYGEGWTAGDSPLPVEKRALKKNAHFLNGVAVFSDDIRDGIKGSVFFEKERGFASGNDTANMSVKFGIVAACKHPQVKMEQVNYSKEPYAKNPASVITYCECHDNNTLWDKLHLSNEKVSATVRKQMHQLALTIVLTSQGIPFLHAGTEFLRDKKGVENSYNKGDSINAIDWRMQKTNRSVVNYVQQLIKIRKAHPAFRMEKGEDIAKHIVFDENLPNSLIAYNINGAAVGDSWKKIKVVLNGSAKVATLGLSGSGWKKAIQSSLKSSYSGNQVKLAPYSAIILYQ
ncbi:MAG: type I pullulanase [Chitinophagaceae bacterium]